MLQQQPVRFSSDENRNALQNFIRMYRDLAVLWDTSLRDYTNREKRAQAYQLLVPIYQFLKRDATVEDVKKKINTLRTNYRKDLKAVESALRAGTVHSPRCWTFTEMDFLRNTEKFLAVNPNFKNESFNFSESSQSSFIGNPAHYHYRPQPTPPPNISEMFHKSFGHVQKIEVLPGPSAVTAENFPLIKRQRQTSPASAAGTVSSSANGQNSDELLGIACDYLSGSFPEEESIARTWTFKLKRLSREQRLLAEKFINDILFEAESGTLHRGSVQVHRSFEPFVRFEEHSQGEEQDKSQSPSVHTSTEAAAKINPTENTRPNESFTSYN